MRFGTPLTVLRDVLGTLPSVSLVDQVEAYRLPGESILDAFERIALHEALVRNAGDQRAASHHLGITYRKTNDMLRSLGARPCDIAREEAA